MDGLLIVAVQGRVFFCVNFRRINFRALRPGEQLVVLSSVCGFVVDQTHNVVLGPNAVVTDGVKNLVNGIIDFVM